MAVTKQKWTVYEFDGFRLDAGKRQLLRDGEPVPMPSKAFDLLLVLVESNGRLVEKEELYQKVWAGQIVEESNLTVQMSTIRKALGERKQNPRYIITVPGHGYRFISEVASLEADEMVIETETLSRITIEKEETSNTKSDVRQRWLTRGNRSEPSAVASRFRPAELQISGYQSQDRDKPDIEPLESEIGEGQRAKTRDPQPYFLVFGAFALLLAIGIGVFWYVKRASEIRGGTAAPIITAERQPKMKRLTHKGRINLVALSPDGRFFAYTVGEQGSYRTELRLGQTNGSSDVALLPLGDDRIHPLAFSADGNWLYYTTSEPRVSVGALYKMPVLGGVPQKLLSKVSVYPVVSPDEKQIAFVRDNRENNTSTVIVANLDGTGERELVVRPENQAIRNLSLSWSADGHLIAFSAATGEADKYEIFAANVATGNVAQITALGWSELTGVKWLKDGSGLLAVARDTDSVAITQIWQIDYPSGAARKITSDLAHYGGVLSSLADSGAFVALQVNIESNIWVAPADNLKAAKQITFGSLFRQDGWHGLDWSPDGRLVYSARIDQSSTLWTMDADGANARQLTPVGSQDRHPSVTADGQFVVFQSNRSGKQEIWRVRTDGGDLQQLTTDGGNSNPSVTPDGRWVVYQHSGGGENTVWRVSLTGGEPARLTDKSCYSPRVSPDGNFIACGYQGDGKTRLAIISIAGGELVKLFNIPQTHNFDNAAIRWSSDARFISYRDWFNGVWRQPVEGGEPKLLENLPVEKFYTYGWSRDGKLFAFTRGRDVRDAILISDFR